MNKAMGTPGLPVSSDVSLSDFQQPVQGIKASDVNQPRQVGSQFEFMARGGISNTVQQSVQRMTGVLQYKAKLKQFEELIQKNKDGANEAYNEAIKLDPELQNWIPKPELFLDDNTGKFMPVKYYEAYATGIKEYKKAKQAEQKGILDEKKADNQQNYQNYMMGATQSRIDQGEKRLGIAADQLEQGNKRLDVMESNSIISATRTADAQDKANKSDQFKNEQALRNSMKDDQQKIITLQKSVANAYDDDSKKDALKQLKVIRNNYDQTLREYKRMKSDNLGEPVDDDAIQIAIDMQNATDGISDDFDKKYGFSMLPEDPQGIGNDPKLGSDIAQRISAFAASKMPDMGGQQITPEMIDEQLRSASPEQVIQAILNLAKSRKIPG